ncbi:hypothetical protein [Virgisporangium ochraceum]|uniref:hypothetical protein n=1 Tax=Virgisporangium ochraceum TaxID=65505 RepID=UPI001941CB33|nr:hypothetical protein [Virgisporangium ochraceum]
MRGRRSVTARATTSAAFSAHLYRMLFSTPDGDPGALVRAASRAQDEFLGIVAAVVGEADAHPGTDKWRTTAEELIATLVELTAKR